ncbi:hypothetical protein CEXT_691861 [Caerostris extrusa]|uniref:Post-SET domain-containing protein n=1 Tax=Caerostris extrusa TaxID=172846 RepID=A0AAV4VFB9_CAEEX|nr:hypothetical protein CEXT_691861 [Caerostris extrusa]
MGDPTEADSFSAGDLGPITKHLSTEHRFAKTVVTIPSPSRKHRPSFRLTIFGRLRKKMGNIEKFAGDLGPITKHSSPEQSLRKNCCHDSSPKQFLTLLALTRKKMGRYFMHTSTRECDCGGKKCSGTMDPVRNRLFWRVNISWKGRAHHDLWQMCYLQGVRKFR